MSRYDQGNREVHMQAERLTGAGSCAQRYHSRSSCVKLNKQDRWLVGKHYRTTVNHAICCLIFDHKLDSWKQAFQAVNCYELLHPNLLELYRPSPSYKIELLADHCQSRIIMEETRLRQQRDKEARGSCRRNPESLDQIQLRIFQCF